MHAQTSGVASIVVADAAAAQSMIGSLLSYLPAHCDELPPQWSSDDPPTRAVPEVCDIIPESSTGSYDVRHIIETVSDVGSFLELRAGFAPNLVTGFAMIAGRSVGVVANQPQALAGTLDIGASQKGARFVAMCDAFNLPLLTFVDTSGFYPGKDLEWRGMIRYGAQMAFAYARARVPRVCVTLRKSYGGAYIVMDSKYMGNDLSIAWPSAEIAVMGAKGAVEILHRRASVEERGGVRIGLRGAVAQPVHRRRTRLGRPGHRSRRHPRRGGPLTRRARDQTGEAGPSAPRQYAFVNSAGISGDDPGLRCGQPG